MIKGFKIYRPGVGFYLTAASLVLAIAAFVLYGMTFSAFGYDTERWVVALMTIALWGYACILVNGLLFGNARAATDIMYVIDAFCVTLALIKFLIPCLSPIGIYFTVHNMGDVERNAIGVPRSIVGVVFFVLTIVTLVTSAFFSISSRKHEADWSKAEVAE